MNERPENLIANERTTVLNTDANMAAPDDFYEALLDMHRDLTDTQSAMANARLILLLANHIGDMSVLREAMRAARAGVPGPPAEAHRA